MKPILHMAILLSLSILMCQSQAADSDISDVMPYDSKTISVNGVQMHYVEGGDPAGEVFLFLHGNPSSSYLWRNVMPHIEPLGRVIAVDLVGFGQSGKPDLDYTFQTHSIYVNGFVEAMKLKNITLVIHDWGSALGLEYARTHAHNVNAIAMMEAIIPPKFPMQSYAGMGQSADLFRQFRDPKVGRELLMEQNMFVEGILNQATLTRKMSEVEKTAYREPFGDKSSRFPIFVWPNELPIEGEPARNVLAIERIGNWLRTSETPKLLLYANPGALISEEQAMWMQANYRNLEAVYIGTGAHYVQEDQPHAIGRNIYSWYLRAVINR
jgi:haloalkane dehalogenase